MSYELAWHSAGDVLCLDLVDRLSVDEMRFIDRQTTALLDESDRKITLLIDVSALVAVYNTVDQLRATQLYRDHPRLETIIIITSNKLNRLITLLAFHLSRARVIQVENVEQAYDYISSRGANRR